MEAAMKHRTPESTVGGDSLSWVSWKRLWWLWDWVLLKKTWNLKKPNVGPPSLPLCSASEMFRKTRRMSNWSNQEDFIIWLRTKINNCFGDGKFLSGRVEKLWEKQFTIRNAFIQGSGEEEERSRELYEAAEDVVLFLFARHYRGNQQTGRARQSHVPTLTT